MKILYHLFVNGEPKPQPRPQVLKNGHVYTPHNADAWKEEIKAAFRPVLKPLIIEPIFLQVAFHLPRPQSMKGVVSCIPHAKRPDTDNLLKAVMDAMTDVGVWKDDALVYRTDAAKYYAHKKTGAQIIVQIK